MSIPSSLRFRFQGSNRSRFSKLKYLLEESFPSDERKIILEDIVKNYNPEWVVMDRCEAALGENNDTWGKHIRFKRGHGLSYKNKSDEITINQIHDSRKEKWKRNELRDLCNAIVKVMDSMVGEDGRVYGILGRENIFPVGVSRG